MSRGLRRNLSIHMVWGLAACAALAIGCSKGGGQTSKYAGTDDGAKQLLTEIRSGDAKAMTQALKPTSADYAAVFVADAASKAEAGYEKLWSDPRAVITADPANTELKIWKATSDELQKGTGESAEFPGGYKRIAGQLKPGITIYRWKYVKPGATLGMAFDGLVYVNGHWAWFPKPWRALGEGRPGGAAGGSGSGSGGGGGE